MSKTHALRRTVIAPFVVAALILLALASAVPGELSPAAEAQALKDTLILAHGHGTIGPRTTANTFAAPAAGGTFTCDWFGGWTHPWSTNQIMMDAYGDCEGTTLTWTSALNGRWGSNNKTDNKSSTSTATFREASQNWGTVSVAQQVTWAWNVTMQTPSSQQWTTVNDPACTIQPNPTIVICAYTGVVTPFPVAGTSTPTATPFPTFSPVPPECTDVFFAFGMQPKAIHTVTVFENETYTTLSQGSPGALTFSKIERDGRWTNQTTGAFGNIARANVPLFPSTDTVFFDSQIGGVGTGFITAALTAQIQLSDGSRCEITASANVTN